MRHLVWGVVGMLGLAFLGCGTSPDATDSPATQLEGELNPPVIDLPPTPLEQREAPRRLPTDEVAGELLIGCTELTKPLLERWIAQFNALHPKARVAIELNEGESSGIYGGGYSLATMQLAEASEVAPFVPQNRGSYGADETSPFAPDRGNLEGMVTYWPVIVAIDRLEVIVNPKNRVAKLTVNELAWIFYESGKSYVQDFDGPELGGFTKEEVMFLDHPRIVTWSELGQELARAPIRRFQRHGATRDRDFFERKTIGEYIGDGFFCPRLSPDDEKQFLSSQEVLKAVANDPYGIGYVSHAWLTEGVRAVPVEGKSSNPIHNNDRVKGAPYAPDLPGMQRPVFLWIRPDVDGSQSMLEAEFTRLVLSEKAQAVASECGLFPVPPELAQQQREATFFPSDEK